MKNNATGFNYSNAASTSICFEQASDKNPYVAEKMYLAGYDLQQLVEKRSFVDTLFLLFKGELPSSSQAKLLESLMIALINAGPRDAAVKAAMTAGVSKTKAEHIIPIGLNVLGGEYNGAQAVASAYQFIEKSLNDNPGKLMNDIHDVITQHSNKASNKKINEQLSSLCPGFNQYYGDIDLLSHNLAKQLFALAPQSPVFNWVSDLLKQLNSLNIGITPTGLAGAVFLQLKLGARESIGLYQLLRAPGILAHGMEQTHKPVTAIPMLPDEQYHFSSTEKRK
ncbi:hypothetical protein [Thalassotalea sp. PLHSN55]|uniref:hypothetical protein n=1 Tax=Thalassotalea sp. PLHSN55 TaxID=3435888 RepID=UPI003F85BB6D